MVTLSLVACQQIFSYAPSEADLSDAKGPDDMPSDARIRPDAVRDVVSVDQGSAEWIDGWDYRRRIVVNHTKVPGEKNLEGFPLLVKLTSVGPAFLFATEARVVLAHEVEPSAPEDLVAWVKIPALSPTQDTVIYLYHGGDAVVRERPGDLWDSYAGVWHMADFADSSGNNSNGMPVNGPTPVTRSRMGSAYAFDGVDDLVKVPNSSSLDLTGTTITLEAWVKPDLEALGERDWENPAVPLGRNGVHSGYRLLLGKTPGNNAFRAVAQIPTGTETEQDALVYGKESIVTTDWIYIAATYDGQGLQLYLNGKPDGQKQQRFGALISTTDSLVIGHAEGANKTHSYPWHGEIDELRISSEVRPAAWIETQHNNTSSPDTFYTVSEDETK